MRLLKPSLILELVFCVGAVCGSVCASESAIGGQAATYFVAPGQKGEGTFSTIQQACEAARKDGADRPRKVVIAAGEYFLDKPLLLTEKDSGLTIEAARGAKVVLYGGRRVTDWEKDGDKFYAAELPGVKDRTWDFRALIVNGRYCLRARLPETGTFTHESVFDVPWMTTTGGGWKRKPTEQELTTMKYRPEDISGWLDVNNAEVMVYHMWDESLVGLAKVDAESHTLTFRNPAGHPAGAFGVKKYVVWNVRQGLTRAGQWYLDRTAGKVVYWPLPGEDMSKATVFAPALESVIPIAGSKGKLARDITIRGLSISVTTTPLKAGGFGAAAFDGAVRIGGAEDCRLVDLEIFNVGGQGIKAAGENTRIEGCHVSNTGACGINIRGDGWAVCDNHVHDVGLTYPSAIAVSAGGSNAQISHNEIHDCPYSAVTCGGENNRIENNLIHHAMKELHDGAGIYCFAGKNLTLRGNFIRDIIDTGGYGASAYYLDERSEGCLVEGNLSLRVVRPSHNHMAKGNTIRNNVFISDEDMTLTFPRSTDYVVERNVLYAKGKIVIQNPDAITTSKDNVMFSVQGKIEAHKLDRYNDIGTYDYKAEPENSIGDPLISDFDSGKVRFGPDSPAVKLGIEPIDVRSAGVRRGAGQRR